MPLVCFQSIGEIREEDVDTTWEGGREGGREEGGMYVKVGVGQRWKWDGSDAWYKYMCHIGHQSPEAINTCTVHVHVQCTVKCTVLNFSKKCTQCKYRSFIRTTVRIPAHSHTNPLVTYLTRCTRK